MVFTQKIMVVQFNKRNEHGIMFTRDCVKQEIDSDYVKNLINNRVPIVTYNNTEPYFIDSESIVGYVKDFELTDNALYATIEFDTDEFSDNDMLKVSIHGPGTIDDNDAVTEFELKELRVDKK